MYLSAKRSAGFGAEPQPPEAPSGKLTSSG